MIRQFSLKIDACPWLMATRRIEKEAPALARGSKGFIKWRLLRGRTKSHAVHYRLVNLFDGYKTRRLVPIEPLADTATLSDASKIMITSWSRRQSRMTPDGR
jgi:hypothetical protein